MAWLAFTIVGTALSCLPTQAAVQLSLPAMAGFSRQWILGLPCHSAQVECPANEDLCDVEGCCRLKIRKCVP